MKIISVVSEHVNNNPDLYHDKFTDSDLHVKKLLEVDINDFIKGSPDNDWSLFFDKFEGQLRENIYDKDIL